jgi:hypothetical protein
MLLRLNAEQVFPFLFFERVPSKINFIETLLDKTLCLENDSSYENYLS